MKVIDGETAAKTYDFVIDNSNNQPPVKLKQKGLAGAETVDLQASSDGGTSYEDVYEAGTQAQLSVTNTDLQILAPGYYRLNKGVTAGGVTVSLSTMANA